MDMCLTPKQLHILNRIRDIRTTHGYSPTMQELADELGLSKVTVFEHVEALIRKKALTRQPNRARSLEINPDWIDAYEKAVVATIPESVGSLGTHRESPRATGHRPTRLPLVGSIAAGSPIEAVEERQFLDLEDLFASREQQFVLRVRGDSMIEDQICDGDYVVCRKAQNARNGETVVALLDSGEATLKRFYHEGRQIRLQPANSAYKPIVVDARECRIQGIVTGVIRTL